ncbi:unnamed protein product, partial [Darwinula stevensoni]
VKIVFMTTYLLVIIALALIFDYINGFHDAANSIATVVSTKVLSPFQAVLWAAFFNVVAYFIFKDHAVANTIGKTVFKDFITLPVIFSGLIAAIFWNLLTWWYGIPSSSSHTLIGGFAGAALTAAFMKDSSLEVAQVIDSGKIWKTVAFIFLAPLIGMVISIEKIKEPTAGRTATVFKRLQLLSSAGFSIGHGGNDAQKVMGIISAAMVANGSYNDVGTAMTEASWIPIACYIAIGLGTLSGGWKIVKTMGSKITKVTPLEGVAAETAGATTLFLTEQMGIPVSTTHTITGSIIGAGATKRLSAVRWGVTINLLWAWILTIPVSALLAAIVYFI